MLKAMSVFRRLRSRATAVLTMLAVLSLALGTAPATAFSSAPPVGIDVSGHQRGHGVPIHWHDVAADGQTFAFIKATEGENWVNNHFLEDAHAAHQAGVLVGTYHYARPAGDARLQAAHYAATLAAAPQHSLPPVLDIEVTEGLDPAQMQQWVGEFLAETEHLTGRVPMIYTYSYFWREHLADTDRFTRHPLWLAAYQRHMPEPVGGWSHLTFWQRSETGRVPGIHGDVDLNIFNGTAEQLRQFVGAGPGVPAVPEAPEDGAPGAPGEPYVPDAQEELLPEAPEEVLPEEAGPTEEVEDFIPTEIPPVMDPGNIVDVPYHPDHLDQSVDLPADAV